MKKDMTFTKCNLEIAQICHHTSHQVRQDTLTEVLEKLQSICDDSLESTLLIAKVKCLRSDMIKLEKQSAKIQYAVVQVENEMKKGIQQLHRFEIDKDYTK